jgi:hypothetical protein
MVRPTSKWSGSCSGIFLVGLITAVAGQLHNVPEVGGAAHKLDRSGPDQEVDKCLSLPDADTEVLARAWLEVNCAVCHRPDGIAPHDRDMRFHITADQMNLLGEQPNQGQLGPPDTLLIRPSRPRESEIFGERSYASLREVEERVDIVNVFRAPAALPEIARDAVAIGAGCLWCQFGVINPEGARIAEEGGLAVVMDRCIKVEHARYVGRMHWLGFNTDRITSVRGGLQ